MLNNPRSRTWRGKSARFVERCEVEHETRSETPRAATIREDSPPCRGDRRLVDMRARTGWLRPAGAGGTSRPRCACGRRPRPSPRAGVPRRRGVRGLGGRCRPCRSPDRRQVGACGNGVREFARQSNHRPRQSAGGSESERGRQTVDRRCSQGDDQQRRAGTAVLRTRAARESPRR